MKDLLGGTWYEGILAGSLIWRDLLEALSMVVFQSSY